MKRIVLTTVGSYGDVHPYIALGLGLQQRGHEAIIATMARYRAKIEATGLGFRAIRAFGDEELGPELMKRAMDRRKGTAFIIRELVMPTLRDTYRDTLEVTAGADLLIAHPLTIATRLVAEGRGIPWVSTQLAPCGFLSPHDPPILPIPGLARLRFLGPRWHRPLYWWLKRGVNSWMGPHHQLRADLALAPEVNPLFEGNHSPSLVLALFSSWLGARQPDWPAATVQTGFPFYDQDGEADLSPDLRAFLDAGAPPVVFTLGTAAVRDAGSFYDQSLALVRRLGQRAVLLVGKETGNRPATLPDGVAAFDYAPFSALFPRAAVIVHQGGVGTTGQAMRAGRPMLVVPYAHDQPDNAERVGRLGIGRTIPRHRYTADRAVPVLRALLEQPGYAARAAEIGAAIRQESGVESACDALETLPF